MDRDEERRLARLGPFELKDRLVALAKHRDERAMLNAGRGNPNWLALEPRAACFRLGGFALAEAAARPPGAGFGGLPQHAGLASRLRRHLREGPDDGARALLEDGLALACTRFGFDEDRLAGEWVDGVLGDHYPLPPRMLPHAETIVRAHLVEQLFGGDAAAGAFEFFAVEGASAGIAYALRSLVHAGLLAPGDRIAVGVPIFTPYLEIPRLPEFRFEVVGIAQDAAHGWRTPPAELDRLRDPRVRAFLAVNPSNPTGAALSVDALARVAAIAADRPDLTILTDDVYAPFVEGFRSLAAVAPRSTVLLYSFSKFWGATGMRLGVVGLHASNALDERIARAGPEAVERDRARYGSLSPEPHRMKLVDRMVADSRAVGLNHTAGLSTPQQVLMTLLALDALRDAEGERRRTARGIVARRWRLLHEGLGVPPPEDPGLTRYYATIDLRALARARHGEAFAEWLADSHEPIDAVVRLAEERGIVLLDGLGFGAPRMSVRVSLANLPDEAYPTIGRAIVELIDDYRRRGGSAPDRVAVPTTRSRTPP